jgi:CHASE2 domain-containing sensor protein
MPREDRIVQTFGWQPVAWGVLSLVGSGYVAYQPSPEAARAGNYAFCAVLAFGALLLIVYEWWRRSRPIVLTPGGGSLVWGRLFCEQLVLPGQSRFGHSVLVRRRDYPRVFRAALPPDTAGR